MLKRSLRGLDLVPHSLSRTLSNRSNSTLRNHKKGRPESMKSCHLTESGREASPQLLMFLTWQGTGLMQRSYSLRDSKSKSLNVSKQDLMPSLNMSKKAPTSSNTVKTMKFAIPKSTSDPQKLKILRISKTMSVSRSNGIKSNIIASLPLAYLNKFVSTNMRSSLIGWKLSRTSRTHFSAISVKEEVIRRISEAGKIYRSLCTNKFNQCNLITTSICKQLNMLHNQLCRLAFLLVVAINLPSLSLNKITQIIRKLNTNEV